MELKRNDDNNTNQPYNGSSSYTQQNNPYGQGDQNGYYGQANQSNPYGQVNQSSPYGQPNQSNPYGQQNPYGQSNVYDPSQAYYTQRAVVNGQPYNNQAYGDNKRHYYPSHCCPYHFNLLNKKGYSLLFHFLQILII